MIPEAISVQYDLGSGRTLSMETGRLAKQAGGAVMVRLGDTMVLCTAVLSDTVREEQSFFPLTVDYRENFSSGGKIPGGFIKREGRSNDKEIITSRLVDRAIRPLFPDGFRNPVQVLASVVSADDRNNGDMLACVGASAALLLAGAPFDGPIAEVRIGRINGSFVVNPSLEEVAASDFNLVVAGKPDSILMVEGEMKEVQEEEMLEALQVAHAAIRELCSIQVRLVAAAGAAPPFSYTTVAPRTSVVDQVRTLIGEKVDSHVRAPYQKSTFYDGLRNLRGEAVDMLLDMDPDCDPKEAGAAASCVERDVMRELVLSDQRRIDGRSPQEVRPIWCQAGYLPRVHGSAIFTRGETQVLASVTLGTTRDVQPVDQVFDDQDKRFFLHYEFPPFSTGEVKMLRGASRREVGHGFLAERALQGMLPDMDVFPYTIRVNADVLESNGSSSMASVCSGSMALMDAGVPVRAAVAGVAMGLISDGERSVVLTDILGTEDHLGDMDFKVTGTRKGITACQMDIKIGGLSQELMLDAMVQAREARFHILDMMDLEITESSESMSPYAPRLTHIVIDATLIGALIGPGGKVIKGIQASTGATVEVEERDGKGYVTVSSTDGDSADAAIEMIRSIVTVPEVGDEYEGTVRSLLDFGAILEILPGKEGLLHISELDYGYVEHVTDHVQVGDKVRVRILEIRDGGKIRLSRKALLPEPDGYTPHKPRRRPSGRDRGPSSRRPRGRSGPRGRHK